GIVERRRGALEGRLLESPGRRPLLPQEPADLATVLLQSDAATLGVEVPLIPVRPLLPGRGRTRRGQRVLHVVAADADEGPHARRGEERGDAGGAAAPVVADESDGAEGERVQEIEEVLADGGLLGHARFGGVEEASGAVAAQIGNENAMARG